MKLTFCKLYLGAVSVEISIQSRNNFLFFSNREGKLRRNALHKIMGNSDATAKVCFISWLARYYRSLLADLIFSSCRLKNIVNERDFAGVVDETGKTHGFSCKKVYV